MSIQTIQDLIPIGRPNRPGRVNPMEFITIHNTGNANAGANARAHANYLKSDAAVRAQVSWHWTVDDTCAIQHIPNNEDAWHAGDGAGNGNRKSIGIEICMNSDGDLLKATDNTVLLVAQLCTRHNIPVVNIRQHFNWSGKACPQMLRSGKPYNWDTFLNKVRAVIDPPRKEDLQQVCDCKRDIGTGTSEWAKDAHKFVMEYEISDGQYPQNPCTREMVWTMLYNYHNKFVK
jgi:N-acetylmuramoyl-L-alanine amidase